MATDGFIQPDPERQESLEAVRSVLADVLDRDGGWAELAGAGLLGLAVPEAYGGEGLGLPEVSVLLRETATRARHLPVWETLCCATLTLGAHGTDDQQRLLRRGRDRHPAADPRGARAQPHDLRRRHRHRTQDRGHLRGRLQPPPGHGPGGRPPGRGAGRRERPRSDPAGVGLECPDHHPHRAARQRPGRAPGRERCPDAPRPLDGRSGRSRPRAWWRARGTSPRRTSRAAPSSAARWPSSRRSRCRSPTSTSPPAPWTSRRPTPAGGSTRGSMRATTSRSRRTGPAPRDRRRCAPATTCTAAWASTRPTRCTTTSAGSPTSRTRSTCAPRR